MSGNILVGSDLSSLFPESQAISVLVQTSRQNIPLPQEPVSLAGHAAHAAVLHTPSTGTILLRVLHGGLIIQLLSLSNDISPIQFVFPSPVLPSPAVFLWESNELHVLAVTVTGSLYRLVIPVREDLQLWADNAAGVWTREYLIKNYNGTMEGLVHVQGTHCVAMGLPSGSLLRLETEYLGNEGTDDEWQESLFHSHGSFLSSLTSFLSARSSSSDMDIVSMATHPWPTDVGHVFTLSRDRVLKLWKPKLGCVAVKSLDGSTENASQSLRVSPASQPRVLLPGEKQTLLRVFSVPSSTEQDQVYVIAFLPTPSSPTSGGTFHILDTQGDQFSEIATISCSTGTARCTLQDFMIITPNGTTAKSPVLHTLWDRDGKSVIEWRSIASLNPPEDMESDEEDEEDEWQSASYAPEPELTPLYLDEVLHSPGSMSDKFFEAIMRPGMFSPLTLQTALDQYINACLSLPTATSLQSHIFPPSSTSLPGAPGASVPAALTQTYSSIAEHIAAVVGCTVTLNTNLTTGEVEHGRYWVALKRDWEGFIARCREIERAARGPLVLGAIASPTTSSLSSTGGIVVVVIERERAGILAIEDLPIGVWKSVISSTPFPFSPNASPYPLLQYLHILRNHLYDRSPTTFRELEGRLVDIVHQETAFSFKDILQDLISRIGQEDLHEMVDQEGSEVSELLSSIRRALGISRSGEHDPSLLEDGFRAAFDIIGGFDAEIKLEEEEEDVERLLAPLSPPQAPLRDVSARPSSQSVPSSQWDKALTSAYVTTSTNARYELCLSLVMLFYFVFNDEENAEIDEWDSISEGLLAEVFAVLRGVAALRKVVRQAGGRVAKASDPDASLEGREDDDVVSLMRNMNVKAENRSLWASSSSSMSLVRTLLSQEDSPSSALLINLDSSGPNLPAAAHRFLDATGLLQSMSPALATPHEVAFCENLRQLGYHDLARELLSWLPRTPGVTYVLARLWLDIGRADDAAYLLEKLGGSFGPDNGLSIEDSHALGRVLPGARLLSSACEFYVHVAGLFKARAFVEHEIQFTQLAISTAPQGSDTSGLWHTVIKGYTDLGWFEDAYASWVATPYEKLKQDILSQLVYRMCEDDAIEQLTSFTFAGYADEVEATFAFKARNVDPRIRPNYSRILYSWYTLRGDYRNAALAMYQRARKLHDLIVRTPSLLSSLAHEELEAYLIAMNALSLVDEKNAWILVSGILETAHPPPHKRVKLTKYIPEDKFSSGKFDVEVIHLADIERHYSLFMAQVDLVTKDPTLMSSPEFLLPPASIVLRLAQSNDFDKAIATARTLKVDMTDLFSHLTIQCLRLSKNPDIVMQEVSSVWLLTDKLSCWTGSPADRAWRYLRQCLDRNDSEENDYTYTKVVFETIMVYQKDAPPPWLVQSLEEHHHEYLIRSSLRYDNLDRAIEYTLSLIRKADGSMARVPPRHAGATWLPYGLIDQVLAAAMAQESTPARLSELRAEVANRLKKMQGHNLTGHVTR